MERTVMPEYGKIRWQKTGGGVLVLGDKRKIRSGDVFLAFPHEIPKAFRDTVKALESVPVMPDAELAVPKVTAVTYSIEKRGNSNWFNVVNSQGKVINEKALKKADAEEYIKNLEG